MRELRHRLREYLSRVQAGERFEVTSFGQPVAQLLPSDRRPVGLAQLIAEGHVTPALDPDTTTLPMPVPPTMGISATATLLAERDADPR